MKNARIELIFVQIIVSKNLHKMISIIKGSCLGLWWNWHFLHPWNLNFSKVCSLVQKRLQRIVAYPWQCNVVEITFKTTPRSSKSKQGLLSYVPAKMIDNSISLESNFCSSWPLSKERSHWLWRHRPPITAKLTVEFGVTYFSRCWFVLSLCWQHGWLRLLIILNCNISTAQKLGLVDAPPQLLSETEWQSAKEN